MGSEMSFADAIRRLIRDYVVIGAVAAASYVEPVLTEDIGVVVLVDTDDEFWEAYRRVGDTAKLVFTRESYQSIRIEEVDSRLRGNGGLDGLPL